MTRILYVEDNDDNVYMLKMRLELLDGFEVLVADGRRGCAKAAAELPDLILMDLDLPGGRRLGGDAPAQGRRSNADIPIIALTAHAMSGSREKALAAGCDEFDTKPDRFRPAHAESQSLACQQICRGLKIFGYSFPPPPIFHAPLKDLPPLVRPGFGFPPVVTPF